MGCASSEVVPQYDSQLDSETGDKWLNIKYPNVKNQTILRPHELKPHLKNPPKSVDEKLLNRILGSMIGLALGDALGAHVEFRPHQYLIAHPVKGLEQGGTWGLQKGQFTDDTSMALCLAISLIVNNGFNAYDQLVRFKWWYRYGYMSSTGQCFDIGAATRQSLNEFQNRQRRFAEKHDISVETLDYDTSNEIFNDFKVDCGKEDAAGNGSLMRLAPVPLFFHKSPKKAVKYSGCSSNTTHGDPKAYDACRFYAALIVAAIRGESKEELLDENFYKKHRDWFGKKPLDEAVITIAEGSFKIKDGYEGGIRGKGFVLESLKAALWAFWSDEDSFEKGALAAVNLGDDADTTAAIYGQLAGAYYGYQKLPSKWVQHVYAAELFRCISKWIAYQSEQWSEKEQ